VYLENRRVITWAFANYYAPAISGGVQFNTGRYREKHEDSIKKQWRVEYRSALPNE